MLSLLWPPTKKSKEGGFVLLITLLVVLLLVVIIFEIDFQSRADLRAAGNFRDDTVSYYTALSGIAMGKALLAEDLKTSKDKDSLDEVWALRIPPLPVGNGMISFAIIDEAGKFNLNSIVNSGVGNQIATGIIDSRIKQLRHLFELLEVDPKLVNPIIDWIDKNKETMPDGAEDETYQALPSPYETSNAPIKTLEEILFIKGMTAEVYQKISPYLTVYSETKINVNTADSLILQSLDSEMTESDVQKLIEGRPYKDTAAFHTKLPGVVIQGRLADHPNLFSVNSIIFSIKADGLVHNTQKTIHTIWNRDKKKYLYFKVE